MKYRKKPVEIEAIQYTGDNGWEINNWSNGNVYESPVLEPTEDDSTGKYVQVNTLEGVMIGRVGWFIIRGIKGEYYPCDPDIFEQTYDIVVPFDAHKTVVGSRIDAGFYD